MANKTSNDIQTLDISNWKDGMVSYFSKERMGQNALKAAYNVTFDYNGVVRPRGSFYESGIPDVPEGLKPLACDFPFRRADDSDGLLNIFSDGTNAYLYVLKADGTGWEKFPTPFNKDAQFSIDQIDNVVVFGNGIDKFSYYDIANNVLQQLTKVADPTVAPTVTPVNFGTGTAMTDYYYRVAFNGVGGTTKMSPAVKVTSSNVRDSWGGSKSVTVDISPLTIDPNAKSWSVWIASVNTGLPAPVDKSYMRISNITDMTQKTFSDTGAQVALDVQAPVENSTEGLISPYFKNISGRLWAISPDRTKVYWGGDASDTAEDNHSLYFGTTNGSDSFSIGKGGVERAMSVILGRDNSGTTCINVLTRTMAGQGAIWDVYATTNSITYNGNSYSRPTYQFKKREGNDGTDAPFSAIRENNNVYYLSMEGFKSTGVKPNITGIQSTDIVSSAIRDRILNLTHSDLSKCYAAYYDEAIYWTINYGSDHNNEIWVYDILHGGIWSVWRRTADCIFRWSSNNDKSPSLYIRVGNKLLRYLKESFSHSDFDGVFESYIESGLIAFGDSNLEWVHVLKALWQLNNAMGTVDIVLNVHNALGEIMDTAAAHLSSLNASSVHGGWDNVKLLPTIPSLGAWNHREWDKTLISLDTGSLQQDIELDQRVRQNAAYVSFSLKSNTAETYYELSHFSLLYTYIGVGIEFLTRRNVISI